MSERSKKFDYLHTAPYEALARAAVDGALSADISPLIGDALRSPNTQNVLNNSSNQEVRHWDVLNQMFDDVSEIFESTDLVVPDAVALEKRGFDLMGLKEKYELIKYSDGDPLLLLTPRCFIEGQIFYDITNHFGIGLDMEGYVEVANSQENIGNWCNTLNVPGSESGLGFMSVEWLLGVVDIKEQEYRTAIYTVPLKLQVKRRIDTSLHINEYILAQILLKKRGLEMMDAMGGALLLTGSNSMYINQAILDGETIVPTRPANTVPPFHHRVMTRRMAFNE